MISKYWLGARFSRFSAECQTCCRSQDVESQSNLQPVNSRPFMTKQDTPISVVLRQNVRRDKFSEFEAVIKVCYAAPVARFCLSKSTLNLQQRFAERCVRPRSRSRNKSCANQQCDSSTLTTEGSWSCKRSPKCPGLCGDDNYPP